MFKFNGMWAFAIWDNQQQTLFLARDRFGVKPLLYEFIPSKLFAFASKTLAFKYLDDYKRFVNPELLKRDIINSQSVESTGYTIFQGIFTQMFINSEQFQASERIIVRSKEVLSAENKINAQNKSFKSIAGFKTVVYYLNQQILGKENDILNKNYKLADRMMARNYISLFINQNKKVSLKKIYQISNSTYSFFILFIFKIKRALLAK